MNIYREKNEWMWIRINEIFKCVKLYPEHRMNMDHSPLQKIYNFSTED